MIIATDFTDVLSGLVRICLLVAAIAIPVFGTFGTGIYVLRPLDQAARKRKMPTRFTIVDFLALLAHLSIPMGLIGPMADRDDGARGSRIVLLVFGCFAALAIWFATVSTAAKAGITQPRKRLLMIGFVVPITFVAAVIFGPLLVFLMTPIFGGGLSRGEMPPIGSYLLGAVLPLVFIACRRTVEWILRPEIEAVDEAAEMSTPIG